MGRDGGRHMQRLVFRVSVCVCAWWVSPAVLARRREPPPPHTPLCVSVVVNEASGVSWEQ